MLVEGPCKVGVHQLKGNEGNEGGNNEDDKINGIDDECKEDKQDMSKGIWRGCDQVSSM